MSEQAKKGSKFTALILRECVETCEAIRKNPNNPQDISLGELVKEKHQISMEDVYRDLGINPASATIELIMTLPDPNFRWLVPEIIRDAVRLGIRKAPIYKNLIQSEQSIPQTQITLPAWNMSDAMPEYVGIAETIRVGNVSFDQKKVSIRKMGKGIKLPYELRQYVPISFVSIWLQDFGIKLGMGLDMLALGTLINGDQADGSDSAPVIGVTTAGTLVYRDTLRPWVRAPRLGREYGTMVAGEEMAMDLLELFRYTQANRLFGEAKHSLNLHTPVPDSSDLWIHGAIPDNQVLAVDKDYALIKLNAQPLLVETEKIVSNQTESTYCSLTTGFATIMRDARLILDKSITFAGNGFPTWMNPVPQETMLIK